MRFLGGTGQKFRTNPYPTRSSAFLASQKVKSFQQPEVLTDTVDRDSAKPLDGAAIDGPLEMVRDINVTQRRLLGSGKDSRSSH
jgi:hypothetical protein